MISIEKMMNVNQIFKIASTSKISAETWMNKV
jgi:hypothetical protein